MTERASFLVAPADVPSLRHAVAKIAGVGYSERAVRERLGLEDLTELQWHSTPVCRAERLSSRDPLALAIDLFLLQGTLPAEEIGQLFDASERDVLIRAGLLAIDETGFARARASLFPVGDRLIFSDHAWPGLPHPGYAIVPPDQVMRIGVDSRHLARCTLRRPFRSALDLCTGSGIHALLASAHARHVLAVDINPRAALCTRFNAQISGATNLEVAVGDLFEAIRGQRFVFGVVLEVDRELVDAQPLEFPKPPDLLVDGADQAEPLDDLIRHEIGVAAAGLAVGVVVIALPPGDVVTERLRHRGPLAAVAGNDVGDVIADHAAEPAALVARVS